MKSTLTKQSRRIYDYCVANPNLDIPAPLLNSVAAGEGRQYVSAFSKRVSEVREHCQSLGGDFVLSVDKWVGGQRQTAYKYIPAP